MAVRLANGRELRTGDRVLFNAIQKLGLQGVRRVENGTLGEVVSVHAEQRQVELELAEPMRT